ncbi:MAG: DUF3883 domain-containing protein [Marivibrio sp.]|uniref:DUF3883 domain-containing protein n=1 Tax=Marivibrio sp. TaxID=2039719 RepID=UPI0032EBE47A
MPTFEGLRLIRAYLAENSHLNLDSAIAAIQAAEADAVALDLQASAVLHELVPIGASLDGVTFYRSCIETVVVELQPIWAKTMTAGRKRFISKLSDEDDISIFEAGALLADPPSWDDVSWWDSITARVRKAKDAQKMEQARQAELLSIEYEKKRLVDLGLDVEPEWTGFEDNFAGYDVLSYEIGNHGLVSKLIEVKSTTASPLRFMITRNEWNTAQEYSDNYVFHVWDMDRETPVLYERKSADVAPLIPSDNNKGKWSLAEIPLGAT